jgi:hypothetical protein
MAEARKHLGFPSDLWGLLMSQQSYDAMSDRCAHKTPPLASLVFVGPWRNRATGEETGDIVIHYERNDQLYRLRLSDADAQHLADSINATRATAARRRERLPAKTFADGSSAAGSELPTPADGGMREGARV